MNLNKVFLIGRITQEVEFKYLPSGTAIALFNVATNRAFKDKAGNLKEETEYHRIVAWGKLGELCKKFLTKGRLVFVEGRIHSRSWLDNQGNKKVSYEIIAENVRFGPKSQEEISEKQESELESELDVYQIPENFNSTDLPY